MNSTCRDCQSTRIDHAVVCPVFGIMASGRCKRYQRMDDDRMGEALTFGKTNKREVIKLKSQYFKSDGFHNHYKGVKAYKDGTIVLAKRKLEASGGSGKQRATGAIATVGDVEGGLTGYREVNIYCQDDKPASDPDGIREAVARLP